MNTSFADADADAKQQVTSLFQIYGAIDRSLELRGRSEEPHLVELLLPAYRDPGAYWFSSYLEATGADPGFGVDAFDPFELARAALDFLARSRPRCRMRARRLYAVGAVARTFPDIPPEELAAAALGAREIQLLAEPDAHAERLAALLRTPDTDDSAAARDAWWNRLLSSGLIPDPDGLGPRPCSGQVSWMDVNGDLDAVPTLKTVLDAPISFDDALGFFDPTKWICFPAWCAMDKLGQKNGVRQYCETVSFDCGNEKVLALTVNLDFEDKPIEEGPPRVAITQYKLSDDQPEPQKSEKYVTVNEGWLEIRELSPKPDPVVRITTTKSIQFRADLGGAGLASTACQVGYLSMVEDLICCASKKEGEEGYPDIPFPGRTPPEEAQKAAQGAPGYGGLIRAMVDQTAAAVEQCIDEWTKAAKTSCETLEKGEYDADRMVQDMANYWLQLLREGARFADAGLRVARAAPGAGDRPAARAARQTRAEL